MSERQKVNIDELKASFDLIFPRQDVRLPTEDEILSAAQIKQPRKNCCFRCDKEGTYWILLDERPVRVCEQHQYSDD